jgi:hypothetical protein
LSASIFISHSSQDRKVATTLCAALESRGFSCWISSRDINTGENFQIAIVRAIRNAKMMLLVFTANSNTSEEMSKELALASQQKLIVVPLRVEDVAPNEAFAYEFATRQWIDFFADWEAAINQLCMRLAQAMPPDLPVAGPASAVAAPAPAPVLAEARPAPVVKPPEPAPAPPKAEASAKPARAAEPKPAEVKASDAKPAAPTKPPVEAKREAPSAAPAAPAAATVAAPAPKNSPVGLFIAIGVVAVLAVGAVVALSGHKPAAQASASSPTAPAVASAPAAAPTLASAAPPAASAAPELASNSAAAAAQPDAAADSSASSAHALPKPHHKSHATQAAITRTKADVPY